jgi:hypothetical protein
MDNTLFDHASASSPERGRPELRSAAAGFFGALLVALVACDDPFQLDWVSAPETVVIYSLSRPEPNLPSAFNFHFRTPILVEAPGTTGQWDVALDNDAGRLVFLPPRALGINSRARIAALPGREFHEVVDAPQDTAAYVSDRPVPVALGTVYVVQTGEGIGSFGQRCVFFAKLEPIEVDVTGGQLTFVFDASPICNDTRLIPPEG